MTAVSIVTNPKFNEAVVSFPYDAELVAFLKDAVPSFERRYDPATKSWTIRTLSGLDYIRDRMIAKGHEVTMRDVNDPPPPPPKPATNGIASFFGIDDAEDGFDPMEVAADILERIPEKRRHKVFRAMAKQLYPDLYGGRR